MSLKINSVKLMSGNNKVRKISVNFSTDFLQLVVLDCQTLSGPLPQSGSPAREARGAAAAAPRENGPQRQASLRLVDNCLKMTVYDEIGGKE